AGQTATYTIVIRNIGDDEADVVDVTDALPGGGDFTYASTDSVVEVDATRTVTTNPTVGDTTLNWGTWIIDAGGSVTITFTVNIDSGATNGTYDNTVEVDYDSDDNGSHDVNIDDDGTLPQDDDTPFGQDPEDDEDVTVAAIPVLDVTKVSSAGGTIPYASLPVTITYTMTVTNNGLGDANNVRVNDAVPTGTTYVAASTNVNTPVSTSGEVASDNFDSGFPNSGTGWADSGWAFSGTAFTAVPDSSPSAPNSMRIWSGTTGDYGDRVVDLTGMVSATLTFRFRRSSLESNDYIRLYVGDGVAAPVIQETFSGGTDLMYGTRSYDITAYISATTTIRFVTDNLNQADDILYVDDISIEATGRANQDIAGHAPAGLVIAADGHDLEPGEVMTVTYQVTTDDPLPVGTTSIDNTVFVTSDEISDPESATASDDIDGGPSGSIGDLVWDDDDQDGTLEPTDGDGNRDAGEPGLENITVYLWDDVGTLLATTLTDANGYYLFDGLDAGDYVVSINSASLPPSYVLTTGNEPLSITLAADEDNTDADFGYWYNPTPTLAVISSFKAYSVGSQVVVEWETTSEFGTVGFYLFRRENERQLYQPVNKKLLPSLLHAPKGGLYRYVDCEAWPGKTYTYLLVEVEADGDKLRFGPYTVRVVEASQPLARAPLLAQFSKEAHDRTAAKKARIQASKAAQEAFKATIRARARGSSVRVPRARDQKAKIAITEKGWYFVDAVDIAAVLGDEVRNVIQLIYQNKLAVSYGGKLVASYPNADFSGIHFYGEGIDSIYTDENIYWLGKRDGLRMRDGFGGLPDPTSGGETYTDTIHFEQDNYAYPTIFTDPEADIWLWDFFYAGHATYGTKNFLFQMPGVGPGSAESAALTIRLMGATDSSADPDHHVIISLNGTQIGEDEWDGLRPLEKSYQIDQSLLVEGENTLTVQSLLNPGVPYGYVYLDSFSVSYERFYQAVNDRLIVRGDDNPVVTIHGFSQPTINLINITRPSKPQKIVHCTIDQSGDSYRISFRPHSPTTEYLAFTDGAVSAPPAMIADSHAQLRNRANSANYVIITAAFLKDAADTLAAYRQGQGYQTMVVDLEDIYDEFNYGIVDPHAIRTFLAYTHANWTVAPQYVVLAGEGTFDYKNVYGYGGNIIPPVMVSTEGGLFPSDNALTDMYLNDGLPDIAIGRLPVVTAQELETVIDKIITYESSTTGDWTKRILMLADYTSGAMNFAQDSDEVAQLMRPDYVTEKIYLPTATSLDDARLAVIQGINDGALLVNFMGHGTMDRLADVGLFKQSDVGSLTNYDHLTVFATLTCVAGHFAYPGYDCLAEDLLLHNAGGAVAMWAPSAYSVHNQASVLNQEFFWDSFITEKKVLGDAVLHSLRAYGTLTDTPALLDVYILFGDPALKMW
ncbi:C25 family cysteine peptidase, partial [candidate division CSSED10-310 bacterium]